MQMHTYKYAYVCILLPYSLSSAGNFDFVKSEKSETKSTTDRVGRVNKWYSNDELATLFGYNDAAPESDKSKRTSCVLPFLCDLICDFGYGVPSCVILHV